MFENEIQTRCAICGTGILLGAIFLVAHFPVILLVVPVAVLFLGLVADPEETHAVWYGMLSTLCVFDFSVLTDAEKETSAEKKHYFWFGEVGMAAVLAGMFAVPGRVLACRKDGCEPRVHRCCGGVPAAVCVHAEGDPVWHDGRRRCGD